MAGVPPLPRLLPPDTAVVPTKEIYTEADLAPWQTSDAYARLTLMAARLNAAVTGYIGTDAHQSEMTRKVVEVLNVLETWIDEIPLHQDTQRFGNRAFRDWGAVLEDRALALHEVIVPPTHATVLTELVEQFKTSFGSFVRIDYGSGHELAFLAYLTCLHLTGLLEERDERATVTIIFARYLKLCFRLQSVYNLEPAGSKGVWGLDDHQFLSYVWGSAQLIDHPTLTPRSILDPALTPATSPDLFRLSVAHIRALKRGPFAEHSPLLDNIARTVPGWPKVNSGLLRMWRDDVLGKQPVVQHFRFGGLLSWTRDGVALPRSAMAGRVDLADELDMGTKAPWAMPSTGVSAMGGTKAPWAR